MSGALLISCYSRERLGVVRDTIDGMRTQSFPQQAASRLLLSYLSKLEDLDSEIKSLHVNGASETDISQACRVLLSKIAQVVHRLGVLQRSSSLRLAFELAKSVQALATQILHADPTLATSDLHILCASEWSYSPLYYQKQDLLQDMILFGLPAPESNNALVYPIMAHEVGHAFWSYSKCKDVVRRVVETRFRETLFENWSLLEKNGCTAGLPKPNTVAELQNDIYYSDLATRLSGPVHRQAEETFCDFLGLCCFGSSYLSAFAYLAASGAREDYSDTYCSSATRSSLLACGAEKLPAMVPKAYELAFEVSTRNGSFPYSSIRVQTSANSASNPASLMAVLGELTVMKVAESIFDFAMQVRERSGVTAPRDEGVEIASRYLRLAVPAPPRCSPQEVLCAAWHLADTTRLTIDSTEKLYDVAEWRKVVQMIEVLKETVAKSLEIHELMVGR